MREVVSIIIGFAVASLIPAAGLSATFPLSGDYDIRSMLLGSALLYPFSLFFTVLFGLPAFLILRPFRPGRWWWVLPVGFLLGTFVAVSIKLPNYLNYSDLPTVAIYGALGALSALVFWLIWRRGVADSASARP